MQQEKSPEKPSDRHPFCDIASRNLQHLQTADFHGLVTQLVCRGKLAVSSREGITSTTKGWYNLNNQGGPFLVHCSLQASLKRSQSAWQSLKIPSKNMGSFTLTRPYFVGKSMVSLQGTNITHLGKRKIIFKGALVRDML